MGQGEAQVRVLLPRALLEYSRGEESLEVSAGTLKEVFAQLSVLYPGLGERVLDDQGQVRKYVHVFVNEDSVGHLEPGAVSLNSGDTVHILPSVAGG